MVRSLPTHVQRRNGNPLPEGLREVAEHNGIRRFEFETENNGDL